MKIRPATMDDLSRIAHLWQERHVILNQSDSRFGTLSSGDHTIWNKRTSDRILDDTAAVFVGVDENIVSGYISGKSHAGHYLVDEMAIDAHSYQPGMGRALWNAMQTWCAEQSNGDMRVAVPRYHAVEQAFWRALGAKTWTPETDKDQWQLPPQLIWMTL